MKNRKGFTLTELLAVISILAILLGLGTMSVINVRKNILESQRENLVEYIKTRAMKYADDTGITTVNVETLISEGYLDPDDTTNIYDPVTRNSMNCFLITSTYDNGNLIETNVSEDYLLDTGKCREYDIVSLLIEICRYDASGECVSLDEEWTGTDITLGVRYRNPETKFSDTARYEWSSNIGQGGAEDRLTVLASDGVVTRSRYQIRVTDGDVSGVTSKTIKIDKEKPTITRVDVKKGETWTEAQKDVVLTGTDGNGSGVKDYYLGTDKNCDVTTGTSMTNNKIVLGNGMYYACDNDKVGNVSEGYEFVVNRVDTRPDVPTITASDGIASNTVHTSAFSLEFNKGKNPYGSSGKTEGENASRVHYEYYTSKDSNVKRLADGGNTLSIGMNVGMATYYVRACNEAVATDGGEYCSNYDSYIVITDVTPPAVTSFTVTKRATDAYNQNIATVTIKGKDDTNGSGVYKACAILTNNSASCDWKETTSDSYTGEFTFNSANFSGASYTVYAFVKDRADNISTSSSTTYRLYKTCDSTSPVQQSTCSVSCGGGRYLRYYYDDHNGSYCTSAYDGGSCNTYGCCSSVNYTQTSTCSTECDGGNYKREAYSAYNGQRCSSKDDYNGSRCNTQTCCSSVSYTQTSTCSAKCDGGNYKREAYSIYNGQRCSASDDYNGSRCNTQTCCSSVTLYQTSTCSASCGGGKYKREAYSDYDGSRCSAYDDYNGTSCNNQACCSSLSYTESSTCSASCGYGSYKRYAYSAYNGQRCSSSDDYGGSSCYAGSCCTPPNYTQSDCQPGGYYIYSRYNQCTYQNESYTGGYCTYVEPCSESCSWTSCSNGVKSKECYDCHGNWTRTASTSTSGCETPATEPCTESCSWGDCIGGTKDKDCYDCHGNWTRTASTKSCSTGSSGGGNTSCTKQKKDTSWCESMCAGDDWTSCVDYCCSGGNCPYVTVSC